MASRALVAIAARSLDDLQDDLSLPQFRALVVLDTHGPLSVSALAEKVGVHQTTASRLLARLVTDGLVGRMPNELDRREVVVELSSDGAELVERVRRRRRDDLEQILSSMEPQDREQAVRSLAAFAQAAGEPTEEPWL